MHITLETDYAIRIVDCLARNKGRIGANAISESTCVTLRFSLKILRKLVASGMVRSYKGAQGGYELEKPASEISVGDIIDCIEGKYVINRCLRDGHICSRVGAEGYCAYHDLFEDVSQQVRDKFSEITIEHMINIKK